MGWLPWAASDSSRRLYPQSWSHTDRVTYAVWWGWSGWCGDVAAPVGTDGLAARAGLRPSTLRRRSHPAGLWNHRGDRLAVARWEDPSLDTHREQVCYDEVGDKPESNCVWGIAFPGVWQWSLVIGWRSPVGYRQWDLTVVLGIIRFWRFSDGLDRP